MSGQLKQKAAMVGRWTKILSGKTDVAVEQGPGRAYKKDEIAGYYNDLTGKVSPNTLLDEGGIPVSVIAGGERVHFPIAIFQYALGCWDRALLEKNVSDEMLASFVRCADWALDSQREDGSWDAFGPIRSARYTVSSMAQGEGASVLLRAAKAFGDDRYGVAAARAGRFMLTPYAEGGTCFAEAGGLFLEEYPQESRRSVMNGWIFSLFGLYDLALADPSFRDSFTLSAATLAAHLDDYDAGFWTYYDLERRIASPAYHTLHIAQLKVLANLTSDGRFADKAAVYEGYQDSPANRRKAIRKKVWQKLFEKSDAVILQ